MGRHHRFHEPHHRGNDASYSPANSADGNSISFASVASNLVSGDTNRAQDVFVWIRNI